VASRNAADTPEALYTCRDVPCRTKDITQNGSFASCADAETPEPVNLTAEHNVF
jgi:hypothetical protein